MIRAVLFCRFHPEKGAIVLHQIPEGSVAASATPSNQKPLFDFASVSDYLVPRQELCDQLLSICVNGMRIIGYAACIVDPDRYSRNEYIFNWAVVLDEHTDPSPYEKAVLRVSSLLRDMEERESFLSSDESTLEPSELDTTDISRSKVHAICETILEDLNSYGECMIPFDESNVLNLKLFPAMPPSTAVKAWHVPLDIVDLDSPLDETWDLTTRHVAPYINGVHSVAAIAHLADASVSITRAAVQILVSAGCVKLLDIFQFSATYVATPEVHGLLLDKALQRKAASFVAADGQNVDPDLLVRLYPSLSYGVPLKRWVLDHIADLAGIDIRRFVVFGILNGVLYRVHKYVIASPRSAPDISYRDFEEETFRKASSTGRRKKDVRQSAEQPIDLDRYLDGMHSFDQICTELQMSEKSLLARLKEIADVHIIEK